MHPYCIDKLGKSREMLGFEDRSRKYGSCDRLLPVRVMTIAQDPGGQVTRYTSHVTTEYGV